jgi:hypothetical protein
MLDLLRHRIKIGVSSRGVGSLKRLEWWPIVQDDFRNYLLGCRYSPST